MKKFILAAAATAFMAGSAFAATIEGIVKEFDKEKGTLMLEDGTSYNLPKEVTLPEDLAVGQKVTITTDAENPMDVDEITTSAVAQ